MRSVRMRSSYALLALSGVAVLVLSGCASVAPTAPGDSPASLTDVLAKVKGDAVIDLKAADQIAVAHGDDIAHACYPVLADWLTAATGTPAPTVDQILGVVSAFEKARVTRMRVEGAAAGGPTIPVKVKLACAALVQDERMFALRLAALIGGSSVGVPGLSHLLPK